MGKGAAAENWYKKAIEGYKKFDMPAERSKAMTNLAWLLARRPGRLGEAKRLGEEGLSIDLTLNPGAAEIWKTYNILSRIADLNARPAEASEYRRLASSCPGACKLL
jgi:hypothetical protein